MKPTEIQLHHPVEIDGVIHQRLTVASVDAIANFNSASPERVILSLARVFNVPRRVIRHLEPADAERIGDFLSSLLGDATRSYNSIG